MDKAKGYYASMIEFEKYINHNDNERRDDDILDAICIDKDSDTPYVRQL